MNNEFNQKSIHQITVYAIESAKKSVGDAVMAYIEKIVRAQATENFSFEVEIDLSTTLEQCRNIQGIHLTQEQVTEIESRILNELEIADFTVIREVEKDKKRIIISWK